MPWNLEGSGGTFPSIDEIGHLGGDRRHVYDVAWAWGCRSSLIGMCYVALGIEWSEGIARE